MQTQDSQGTFVRVLNALPDAITASTFLCAWIAPGMVGYEHVRNLMLVMLIEFIVMHSSGFTAGILGANDESRGKRALFLTGLTAFYMVFVLAFSYVFSSTWPIWAFLWLFVSRFLQLFTSGVAPEAAKQRLIGAWLLSALAYIGGVFLTTFLPLPALGITPQVIAALHLQGSGLWIEQPWTVLAFGAFYFAVLAAAKFWLFTMGAVTRADAEPKP